MWGFPGGSDGKAFACNAGDTASIPGSERSPWRRKWQPAPVFLPGKFHGQRGLAGYSSWNQRVRYDWATNTWCEWLQSLMEDCLSQLKYSLLSLPSSWPSLTCWPIHIIYPMNAICFSLSLMVTRYSSCIQTACNLGKDYFAAKSPQSCPTLCDPIEGSPLGSSVPGILQARTLEWLPFPSPMHESEKWKWSRSVVPDS